LSEDVGNDWGQRFTARVEAETDDVFAALDYLRTLPFADTKRIGIMATRSAASSPCSPSVAAPRSLLP
jgi:hypothetical protein